MLNLYPEVTPKPEELKDFKTELHKKNIDKMKDEIERIKQLLKNKKINFKKIS